jgi:hypothetical protein
MQSDSLGNPVTIQDPASLPALNDFVEGVLACEARAANVLTLADTEGAALPQAYCAALHLFAESANAVSNAQPFLRRAQAALAQESCTTPRERRFVAAIEAWSAGDLRRTCQLLEEQVREFPRDLVALKLGQYQCFNLGDSDGMLRMALSARAASLDVPYLHGMLAFGYEQCHELQAAEQSARHGIQMCRKEPWAQHAVAHVMLTQGRHTEGRDFMAEHADTWVGLNSFMVTHNHWHRALFAIELQDFDAALALYDEQVWGVVKTYSQDQVNAVSLLSRLELRGVNVGDRWQDLASYLAARTQDQVSPFLDLHYLYGLARAEQGGMGPSASAVLLSHIEAHALTCASSYPAWLQVALPAARGIVAHLQHDRGRAAQQLGLALPHLADIGGSHAQRDWFAQIYQANCD